MKQNILLLGSGGREHAIACKIAESALTGQFYIAPGNPGMAAQGTCVNLKVTDFAGIADFCLQKQVSLVVVGPEVPLVEGIVDYFRERPELKDIFVVGPSKAGARLEGSKDFAKGFMQRHNIPTARYQTFDGTQLKEGLAFLKTMQPPYVLKADGLCAGKGVLIPATLPEAQAELKAMLGGKFSDASAQVVIEEFLSGIECSVFALTNGEHYLILPEAKDYKRIGEYDCGLNTGGMGSVSPVPFADKVWMQKVEDRIVRPTVEGLRAEGIDYKGFIFFGLINVDGDPMVIEYNCRMGDPETETVMPRLKNDLVDLFLGVRDGDLHTRTIQQDERAAVNVMLVSGGYPEDYRKGFPITGLDQVAPDALIFHSGTALNADGQLITSGGRVISVTCYGQDKAEALANAMSGAARIEYQDRYYRRDIGKDL